jgi:hypothetical protein
MMMTWSTMVVVRVVRVDPGYEVVVEREGGLKDSAEGWKARSISLLAHQSINYFYFLNAPMTRLGYHVYHSSPQ